MKKKILIPLLLIWLLTSCWENVQDKNVTDNTEIKAEEVDIKVNETQQVLMIDEKCIWCSKCARISPENFKMNVETYKAEVISQKNIDSVNVDRAIEICPVDAISRG